LAEQSPAVTPAAGAVIAPAPLGPGGLVAWRDRLRAVAIGIGAVLALLYIPKFFQESILHYRQLQPWGWFRDTFLC